MIKKTLLALAIAGVALTTVTASAHNFYKSDVATVYATTTVKAKSNLFIDSYTSVSVLDKDYNKLTGFEKPITKNQVTGPNLNFTSNVKFGASFKLPNELSSSVAVKFNGPSLSAFDSVGSKTTVNSPYNGKIVQKTKYKLGFKLPTDNLASYDNTEVTLGHPQVGTLTWSDAGESNKLSSVYSFAYSAPKLDLLSGKLALSYAFGYDTDGKVKFFSTPTIGLGDSVKEKDVKSNALDFTGVFPAKVNYAKAVEHDLKAKYTFADDSTFTAKLDRVLAYNNNSGIYTLDSRYVKYSFDYERDICGFDTTFTYAHVTAGKVDGSGSLIKSAAVASNKFAVDTSYTVNDYLAPEFTATYTAYRAAENKSFIVNRLDLELQNTFTAFNYMGVKGTLNLDATYTFSYLRDKNEEIKQKDFPAVIREYGHDFGLAATFKVVY